MCGDDETNLLLRHVGRVNMHASVFYHDSGDIAKEPIRSSICAIYFAGHGVCLEVFFEDVLGWGLNIMLS